MFRDSRRAALGARLLVWFIRSITPLSIIYCCLSWIPYYRSNHWVPFVAGFWAFIEAGFFLFVYLPLYCYLQRPAVHPAPGNLEERRALFQKCIETIPDMEHFVSLWNRGIPAPDVHQENMKEWLCWGFLNKDSWNVVENEELEDYVRRIEDRLGYTLPKGRGPSKSMRVSLDWVNMSHRPLLYYVCGVGLFDLINHYVLKHCGYEHYTVSSWCLSFPLRPQTFFSKHRSPSKHFSYWYRPHKSPDRLPILFIHGIGLMFSFSPFFHDFAEFTKESHSIDSGIGVIAIENLPISFRITHPALLQEELCNEILSILEYHSWPKFALMSASYGTVVTSQLLRDSRIAPRIGPMILIDPIPFLLHLPDTCYNFTRRQPRTASEIFLYYFASMDMCTAHTLSRRFFWNEVILWKEDILNSDRRVTVILSERDIIFDSATVGAYLTNGRTSESSNNSEIWQQRWWSGGELDILWFKDIDHGEILNDSDDRKILVDIALNYCRGESAPVARRRSIDGIMPIESDDEA